MLGNFSYCNHTRLHFGEDAMEMCIRDSEYPGHHQISVLADDSEAGPRVLYLREPRAGLGA